MCAVNAPRTRSEKRGSRSVWTVVGRQAAHVRREVPAPDRSPLACACVCGCSGICLARCVCAAVCVRVHQARRGPHSHALSSARRYLCVYVCVCECMAEEQGAAPGSSCLERSGENVKIKNDEINA